MLNKLCKLFLFCLGFYLFCSVIAFLLKDDANSYSRVLKHEFYNQNKIDILCCGASHVSHGLDTRIADVEFGKNVFNAGTPAQQIDGTVAILEEAVSRYKIEKVFLEMDYGIITSPPAKYRTDSTADYIVLDFLRNPKIKLAYLKSISNSKNVIHSILPIGKNKLMTLNPRKIFGKIKAILTGTYFKYEYKASDSAYAGKGCVLDDEAVLQGSLYEAEFEEPFKPTDVCEENLESLNKIVKICRENGIELVFYSMPVTHFYLQLHQNYDEYISFLKNYAESNGFKYYDFNLCRENVLSLCDSDFSDDNHLNKLGVEKYSRAFCDFFTRKYSELDFFYNSYAEKLSTIDKKLFGLVLKESEDKKSVEIIPLSNADLEKITYDIYFENGESLRLSGNAKFDYPSVGYGVFRIFGYVDGILNCSVEKSYFGM